MFYAGASAGFEFSHIAESHAVPWAGGTNVDIAVLRLRVPYRMSSFVLREKALFSCVNRRRMPPFLRAA
jgi:hypothetical protein